MGPSPTQLTMHYGRTQACPLPVAKRLLGLHLGRTQACPLPVAKRLLGLPAPPHSAPGLTYPLT